MCTPNAGSSLQHQSAFCVDLRVSATALTDTVGLTPPGVATVFGSRAQWTTGPNPKRLGYYTGTGIMSAMIDVPAVLRKARVGAGLTQIELARKAATSQAAVARYETGVVSPSVTTLERLLRACGYVSELRVKAYEMSDLDNDNAKLLRTHREAVMDILARRGFHSPRVFGSTATGRADPDSDIDLLVTPAKELDLWDLAGASVELEELLGVRVDLAVEEILKPEVAARAVREAVPA